MSIISGRRTLFFRLFCLAVALIAAGMVLDVTLRTESAGTLENDHGDRTTAMGVAVAAFGDYLVELERVGVVLAETYSLKGTRTDVHGLLTTTLHSVPEGVVSVGITVPSGASLTTTILTQAGSQKTFAYSDPGESFFIRPALATAREINTERNINWHVTRTNVDSGGLLCRLAVSLNGNKGGLDGQAFLTAGLAPLRELLVYLNRFGDAACISPDAKTICLVDSSLAIMEVSGMEALSSFAESSSARSRLFKQEVIGTGWTFILYSRDEARGSDQASLWIWITLFLVAVIILITEMYLFTAPSVRTADGSGPTQGKSRFGWLRTFITSYRITNQVKARANSELDVARSIQFSLVPDSFPRYSQWREFDIFALLSPAREVGGDYYDFFMLDANRLVVTVGDVSGKSVPASLYMAVSRTAFRTLARSADDPGQLLGRLNEMLVRDNQSGLYVTIACFFVDLPSGKCDYAIAGHPPPIWHRCDGGNTEFIDAPRGTLIGMQYGLEFPVGSLRMRPGDTLLLYTDGVPDAISPDGAELDFSGLERIFASAAPTKSCQDVIHHLNQAITIHTAGNEQVDDITLVAFRFWGPGGQVVRWGPSAAALRSHPDSPSMEGR